MILERVSDKRPQADRWLVAELQGEACHRARWRELTGDEETAVAAALRELAGGNTRTSSPWLLTTAAPCRSPEGT